eukprot:3188023-Rhodomonas_salina.2
MGGGVYMWSSSSGDMPEISENGFDVPPAASIGSKKLKFNSGPGSVAAIEKQAKIQDSLLSAVVDSVGGHMTPADALMILNGRFSDISVKDQPKEVLKWAAQTFPKKRWAQPSAGDELRIVGTADYAHDEGARGASRREHHDHRHTLPLPGNLPAHARRANSPPFLRLPLHTGSIVSQH